MNIRVQAEFDDEDIFLVDQFDRTVVTVHRTGNPQAELEIARDLATLLEKRI